MIDLADRPDVAPELRLVPHAFREAFGRSAEGVWYAPGVVALTSELAVCGRWGAIVAGERRTDGVIELRSINKPAEPVVLPTEDVPAWALPVANVVDALRPCGATLLCSVDLPAGAGLSARTALACAAALALRDLCDPDIPLDYLVDVVTRSHAQLHSHVRVEAAFAGYEVGVALGDARLLIVDTRIRRDTPARLADFAMPDSGSPGRLGPALTEFHRAQQPEAAQDIAVTAAVEAGALGATMLVDEPGRPIAALVRPESLAAVRAGVSGAFRRERLTAPRYLTIRPSQGARRITP
ncbi:hypothetical protein ALI144C_01330 [Actinosynnema sp. ALI-1.44]|uniref:GHMP family kinase ATP-binding protein n=1 Tax=Actinosynnema sp. ALI-1.44 TaxID=1933779 RepID=UPI00097C74AC|nr:hypothetical protein [Actinosynnema sp. ALI-1.44]ONI91352.1 hypothetical protein ALI144C_01330 [Actinosynnema sp. ALI-1.44]